MKRSRHFGILLICLGVGLSLAIHTSMAASVRSHVGGGITVRAVDSTNVSVGPGSVFTAVFLVTNDTDESRRLIPTTELPDGWDLVATLSPFDLLSGGSRVQLIIIFIPAGTLAGDYAILLDARDPNAPDSQADATIHLSVREVVHLSLELKRAPAFVPAGKNYVVEMSVLNAGNSPLVVSLDTHGLDKRTVRLDSVVLHLEANEERIIRATVQTDKHIENRLSQYFRVLATVDGWDEAASSVTSSVDVIPVYGKVAPPRNPLNVVLEVLRVGDEHGGEFRQRIRGRAAVMGGELDFNVALPDQQQVRVFGYRDEYRIGYRRNNLAFTAGDIVFPLSPLTTRGEYGSGGAAAFRIRDFEFRGVAQRPRHAFLDQSRFGGSVRYHASERSHVSLNVLHRDGLYEGTIATMRGLISVSSETTVDAECGIDDVDRFRKPACSLTIDARGSTVSYRAQIYQTGTHYPGSASNVTYRSFGMTLRPFDRWSLRGDYLNRSWALDPSFGRSNRRFKAGLRYSADLRSRSFYSDFSFWSTQAHFSGFEEGIDRLEQVMQISSGFRSRHFGVTASLNMGHAESTALLYSGRLWTTRIQAQANPIRDQTVTASLEIASGFLVNTPIPQKRWLLGFQTDFRLSNQTRIRGAVRHNLERTPVRHTYASLEARIDHEFRSGQHVHIQMRHHIVGGARTTATTEYGVGISIPLSIPLPSLRSSRGTVTGRIHDAQTGAGMSGVILQFGDRFALTDEEGRFRFPAPSSTEFLRLNQQSLGLDRVPMLRFPIEIRPEDDLSSEIDIPVIRGARVMGHVRTVGAPDDEILMGQPSGPVRIEGVARSIVEAISVEFRFRTRTDREGRFAFDNIPPGTYSIHILRSSVPENFVFEKDSIEAIVASGTETSIEFKAYRVRKSLRVIHRGSLRLQPKK